MKLFWKVALVVLLVWQVAFAAGLLLQARYQRRVTYWQESLIEEQNKGGQCTLGSPASGPLKCVYPDAFPGYLEYLGESAMRSPIVFRGIRD